MSNLINKFVDDVVKTLFPKIVNDAISGNRLQRYKRLRKKWYTVFHRAGRILGKNLMHEAEKHTEYTYKRHLEKMGNRMLNESIEQKERSVRREIITQSVKLIKSIPKEYLRKVQKIERKAKSREELKEKLLKINGVTDKQAERIANDQVVKVTQMTSLMMALRNGATMGKWVHVAGLHTSRPTHQAMNNQLFDLRTGMFDPSVGRCVYPGELIACRCRFQAIFPENVSK